MKKTQPLVSIAILNWNGLENTKECLKSLEKLTYENYEVILVDNGSTDGSKEYFKKQKNITFIDLPKNTGFTGGHIEAEKHAKGEYLAILNNDLVVSANWIEECISTFSRHKDAALVGGKSYKWNADNKAYDTNNEYYAFQEVDPYTGYTRTLLVGEEERTVDSISGAALMIKRSVIEKTGYLDEDFFAYYEETDLIARVLRAGYQAYFNPEAYTWHKVAGSSKGGEASYFYLYQMHRNRYIFGLKNLDPQYLKHFKRNYLKETLSATYRYFKSNKTDQEARARINAYKWVKQNNKLISDKRDAVELLGDSYTNKLGKYKATDVTVIIPCYNYAQHVSEAVESILKQTLLPKRIIIINDGSTDNSKEVIDTYKDHPLIEIIHKKNEGVIATKNLGVSLSKTYWTLFLDADDILKKDYINKTVQTAYEYSYDIVYTDMEYFGAIKDVYRAKAYSLIGIIKGNFINNSALIKTNFLKQSGGYKHEMSKGLEDWELYLTLVELGAKPGYVPLAIMKYRQHSDSVSRNGAVVKLQSELEGTIRSLHPRLYSRKNLYLLVLKRILRALALPIRYPFLFVVVLRSIPKAIKQAVHHILHEIRFYIYKKNQISREE